MKPLFSKMSNLEFYVLLITSGFFKLVYGHGRLLEPPGRSTMWRYGFNTPINYNDNQLFCGGYQVQWHTNKGKCGVCGDPFNGQRENEPPEKYATGIISRSYNQGDNMKVIVDITASHKGYFEFRICAHNNITMPVSQDCLNLNLLEGAASSGTRYYLGDQGVGQYTTYLKLPENMTCVQCVLQWRYRTGNRWGCYNSDFTKGPCGLGYGPQEEFYACADIEIISTNMQTTTNSMTKISQSPTAPSTIKPPTQPPSSAPSTIKRSTQPLSSTPTTADISKPTRQSTVETTNKLSTMESTTLTSTTIPSTSSITLSSIKVPSTTTISTSSTKVSSTTVPSTTTFWTPVISMKETTTDPSTTEPKTSQDATETKTISLITIISTTTTPMSSMTGTTIKTSTTFNPSTGIRTICIAAGPWKGQTAVDMWCVVNCDKKFCPSSHCSCSTVNELTGMILTQDDVGSECKSTMDLPENHEWCQQNCPEGLCPPNLCICEDTGV